MSDLISVQAASEKYGIPLLTLLAFINRNRLRDPIGNAHEVYDCHRLKRLARKLAAGRPASKASEVQK